MLLGGGGLLPEFFLLVLALLLWAEVVLFAVEAQTVPVEFLTRKLSLFNNLLDLLLGEAEQNVFRLEVSVYHAADAVEEVQTH